MDRRRLKWMVSVGACGSASSQVSRGEKNNGLAVDEAMIHSCLLQKQDEERSEKASVLR